MNRNEIWKYLEILNNKLYFHNVYAEIGVYGGAVMCLALNARESTHDIDAIFVPKYDVSKVINEITYEYNLYDGWFNDSVKGFISTNNDLVLFKQLSNLKIYMATPEYMFAMKVLSCRLDNRTEINDIKFLINHLGITSMRQAEFIIYKYYPQKRVLPKTFYFLEEILEV